jgi:hypothetical protein
VFGKLPRECHWSLGLALMRVFIEELHVTFEKNNGKL